MPHIVVEELRKTYLVAEREAGPWGALKGLVRPRYRRVEAGRAMVGAALLTAAFTTLMTATMLWTISGQGISVLAPSVVLLGSGLIIPLPLFPDWAQPLLTLLPFRGMADDPFRLYLGTCRPRRWRACCCAR